MIIATLWEHHISIHFSYLPAWELFASMHVLQQPLHHEEQQEFVRRVEADHAELVAEVREWAELADQWFFLVDSDEWEALREKEIPQVLNALDHMQIYRFNQMISYYHGPVSIQERDRMLALVHRYYEEVFREEEDRLRPLLIRQLQEEWLYCKQAGFWNWCRCLHPRLTVTEECVIYRKNHEYTYRKEDIREICATVSTFIHPHLWLYEREGRLQMVRSLSDRSMGTENEMPEMVPEELVDVFRALGDQTRLEIAQLLLRQPATTRELAGQLGITEAAVSRQLKQLLEAGLVSKHRESRGVVYTFQKESVEFLPYRFYEWMLRSRRQEVNKHDGDDEESSK